MIRCVVPRSSCSVRLLTATARRQNSTAIHPDLDREHGISKESSSSPPDAGRPLNEESPANDMADQLMKRETEGPAVQEAEHAKQHPTLSTTRPVKGRELPISPYMDPAYISAKEKHRRLKSPPTKTPTEFQTLLAKNPYALALSTPVRMCHATSVVLPRYFLQDFSLMEHPETKQSWWMPRSLTRKHIPRPAARKNADDIPRASVESEELSPGEELSTEEPHTMEGGIPDVEKADSGSLKGTATSPYSLGRSAYALARQPLIAMFSKGRPLSKGRQLSKTYSGQLRERGKLHKVVEAAQIRPDIDNFMLELLRRRTVEGLEHLAQTKRYIIPCNDWDDAKRASRQPGAILWMGHAPERIEGATMSKVDGPPEFATLGVGLKAQRNVPVHNLEILLGEDHIDRLRKTAEVFAQETLVIRNKRMTIDVQLKLWKLQGYLAKHEQFLDEDQIGG